MMREETNSPEGINMPDLTASERSTVNIINMYFETSIRIDELLRYIHGSSEADYDELLRHIITKASHHLGDHSGRHSTTTFLENLADHIENNTL